MRLYWDRKIKVCCFLFIFFKAAFINSLFLNLLFQNKTFDCCAYFAVNTELAAVLLDVPVFFCNSRGFSVCVHACLNLYSSLPRSPTTGLSTYRPSATLRVTRSLKARLKQQGEVAAFYHSILVILVLTHLGKLLFLKIFSPFPLQKTS